MQKDRLPLGSQYFYLSTNCDGRRIKVNIGYDYRHVPENVHFTIGNYFATNEAAQEMVKIWKNNLHGKSGIGIFYLSTEEVAQVSPKIDIKKISRTDCDMLLKDGIGSLMPLEEFVQQFNAGEITKVGFMVKYTFKVQK